MRLKRVKLRNFRSYKEEATIDLGDLVVFVGRNDSGKSSILDAINIFFENQNTPDKEDLCVYSDEDKDIQITCIFDQLPREVTIDAARPTTLKAEYLLNQEGHLEISKSYSCNSAKPKLNKVFAVCNHPTADKYGDLLSLTNPKLKARADELKVDLSETNATVNSEIRSAIWSQAADLNVLPTAVDLNTEDAKKIWELLKKDLPIFALFKSDRASTDQDTEAQDPMKSAIKEAIKAKEADLEKIASTVKEEVQKIADRTVAKIAEMSPDLARQLTPQVKTKNWDSLFSVSLTADEDIPVNKRGSGTRRLILLNFFRAQAESDASERNSGIIYAVEEPETSQHPNSQIMLVDAFEELADQIGCQMLLTTHTPTLSRRFKQDCLRLVTKRDSKPTILSGTDNATAKEIVNELGVLPDHNIKVFVGLEGRNDISFLKTISSILSKDEEDIMDLGIAEGIGHLVFIPLGGSSLDLWVSRLQALDRPEFYLMDRDTEPPEQPKYAEYAQRFAAQPNCTSWTTDKKELENYIHPDVIRYFVPSYAGTGQNFEDVPALLAQAQHESSGSGKPWGEVLEDQEQLKKKVSRAKKRLNSEFVGQMTPAQLTEIDSNDSVRSWLRQITIALR